LQERQIWLCGISTGVNDITGISSPHGNPQSRHRQTTLHMIDSSRGVRGTNDNCEPEVVARWTRIVPFRSKKPTIPGRTHEPHSGTRWPRERQNATSEKEQRAWRRGTRQRSRERPRQLVNIPDLNTTARTTRSEQWTKTASSSGITKRLSRSRTSESDIQLGGLTQIGCVIGPIVSVRGIQVSVDSFGVRT
jgi:hypothetical protein